MESSFSIICETDTFILIKDNDDPAYASVTNAADYTIRKLGETYKLESRRVIYQDSMSRFDELVHEGGCFKTYKALTNSQQSFFLELLSKQGGGLYAG